MGYHDAPGAEQDLQNVERSDKDPTVKEPAQAMCRLQRRRRLSPRTTFANVEVSSVSPVEVYSS
jgi:hypothetical protein